MATITLDDNSTVAIKAWKNIDPTLIGSDYNRYEIVKWQNPTQFVAWMKSPCKNMDACDRCSGPHRIRNRECSQNWARPPRLPANVGHCIVLMELHTGLVWSGTWEIESLFEQLNRKSGIVLLTLL